MSPNTPSALPFASVLAALALLLMLPLGASANPAIPIVSTDLNSYTQDFNSLGTTTFTNAVSGANGVQTSLGSVAGDELDGWYVAKIAGTGTNAFSVVANNGSANSGAIYNYGSTNALDDENLDRSLGALASGSFSGAFGALIRNDTPVQITGIELTFTAKFWRSSTSTQNVLTFGYGKINDILVSETNFLSATNGVTALPALNIVGPAPVATNGPLNGNEPANQTQITNVMVPVSLAPGEKAFIRWRDVDDPGSDAGLAIDDFFLTAYADALPPPELNPGPGQFLVSTTVFVFNYLSYAEGVEIRYTLDGSTPDANSLLYDPDAGIYLESGNGPIELQTIAIQPLEDFQSAVVGGVYDFPTDVTDLSELRASPPGSMVYRVLGQATFTAGTTFRNTKFFQDSGAGIQIDDADGIITTSYAPGDNVQDFMGRISVFNGQLQMVPVQDFGAPVSSGNVVEPLARTIETLTEADQAMLVTIQDVEFQSAGGTFGGGGFNTFIRDTDDGPFDGVCRNVFGDSNITGATIPSGLNTLTGLVQSTSISSVLYLAVGPRNLADIVPADTPALTIETSKLDLIAGEEGESAAAVVTISRAGDLSAELDVDLTQDIAGAFAADVDLSSIYTPLPTSVTIPADAASAIIHLVALPSESSFNATLTASADGYLSANQLFSIQGSGGTTTFADWADGAPLNSANLVKYAIGGASSPAAEGEPMETAIEDDEFSVTVIVRTDDPTLLVEAEALSDLVTGDWSPDGITVRGAGDGVNQDGVPEGCERRIYSMDLDDEDHQLFLRLYITLSDS